MDHNYSIIVVFTFTDTLRKRHPVLWKNIGNENIRAIVSEFGEGVVQGSEVSRPALGKIVFSDPERRKALENVLYPWLRKKVEAWIAGNPDGILVLNGALLYRAGFCDLCRCVIYVDASYETRLRRAVGRDGLDEKTFMPVLSSVLWE